MRNLNGPCPDGLASFKTCCVMSSLRCLRFRTTSCRPRLKRESADEPSQFVLHPDAQQMPTFFICSAAQENPEAGEAEVLC